MTSSQMLAAWLEKNLVCPQDLKPLQWNPSLLVCPNEHAYPYVDGIPIMLVRGMASTQKEFEESLALAAADRVKQAFKETPASPDAVDPFVQQVIAATSGNLFQHLIGRLPRYPIPDIPLPDGAGRRFLDLGCNWGRWCISAARKGYLPVGIDHNLEAILAARRVAKQLGVEACYLVADARRLPFPSDRFDVVFSYSVLQHFDKEDARMSFRETGRVLTPSGTCVIQMPNAYGPRNFCVQLRRGFRKETGFEVRYWGPRELKQAFGQCVGPTTLLSDGYLSLNPDIRNVDLLPRKYRLIVSCSETLRKLSLSVPWLTYFADSLYVVANRPSS